MKKTLLALTVCVVAACSDKTNKIATTSGTQESELASTNTVANRLEVIDANAMRIDAISTWTKTDTLELEDTTESGEATYFYLNGMLEKIVATYYGEMFQRTATYYLLDRQLSLVISTTYHYNRPLYYDEEMMLENNDSEAFDFDKSTIVLHRSYFEDGVLIHRLSDAKDTTSTTEIDELTKIMTEFKILTASNNN